MSKQWRTVSNHLDNYVAQYYVLDGGEEFYIAYNPNMGNMGIFASDNGQVETSLVKRKSTTLVDTISDEFFILNGDFREQYENLVDKGFCACYRFYRDHKKEHGSSWSSDYDIEEHEDEEA